VVTACALTPADVQAPIEFLVQLLFGIKFRHLLLLGLLCCREGRKLPRARLQMANWRAGHSGRARDRLGDDCAVYPKLPSCFRGPRLEELNAWITPSSLSVS
jgi:hypothetical protein